MRDKDISSMIAEACEWQKTRVSVSCAFANRSPMVDKRRVLLSMCDVRKDKPNENTFIKLKNENCPCFPLEMYTIFSYNI